MAINKNHEFEDLNGVKCAIVEKNVQPARVIFLKELLEYNHYLVISIPSPAPKAVPGAKPSSDIIGQIAIPSPVPLSPETFTVGVTDVAFNATNAIFGRLLHTSNGHVVTLAYWQQKENSPHDEIPYFD